MIRRPSMALAFGLLSSILQFAAILSVFTLGANAQTVTASLPAGANVSAVAVNPISNKIYAADSANNIVTVINGVDNTTTGVTVGANPIALAVNPVTNKIYVANSGVGTVTVIDGVTNEPSAPITVGSLPCALAINPVTNKIYVANQNAGGVTVIDGATSNTLTLAAGVNVHAIAVNPTTNTIYAAIWGSGAAGSVIAINGATNATISIPAGSQPKALAVNPVTNSIYVANSGANSVIAINGATNAPTAPIAVGSSPQSLAVNTITNTIYVANSASGNVTIINGATNVPTNVALGTSSAPAFIAVNAATNQIYVADNSAGGSLWVINGATNTAAAVSSSASSVALAVNPVTNMIFAAGGTSGSVTAVNATVYTTSFTFPGLEAYSVVSNPTADKFYFFNYANDQELIMLDGSTGAQKTIYVGANPVSIDVNPLTNKVYVANEGYEPSTPGSLWEIDGVTNHASTFGTGYTLPFYPSQVLVDPVTNTIYANAYPSVDIFSGATGDYQGGVPLNWYYSSEYQIGLNAAANTIYGTSGFPSAEVFNGAFFANQVRPYLVNPFTNQLIFFAFECCSETYLMHIVDAGTFASITIPAPDAVALNPATNQIYGASGGQVFLINAVTGQTTPVLTVPTSLYGVNLNLTVNPATNNLYVSIQPGDGGSASTLVVDGASNSVLQTLPEPVTAVNPLANQVLLVDYLVSGPAVQAAPVTTTITPLANNLSSSPTPTFTFQASGAAATVPDSVYFQVDSRQGPWSVATAGNSTFTGTVPPLPPGYHTLYAFAGDGQEATSAQSGSPLTGAIQSYGFVVQLPTSVQATVGTNISGVAFTVDGVSYTSTQTFSWANSSSHTIAVPSLQALTAGTQYFFSAWNDGGAISHMVIVETYPTTYTANLTTQYLLTTAATPGGTVSAGGFFNANATVTVRATPAAGYGFLYWSGPVADPTNPITTVTMTGPQSVTANFQATNGPPAVVSLNPSSGSSATQIFTAVYADPNGAADLNLVSLLVNSSVSAAHGCYVLYYPSTNLLYLKNDAGTANSAGVTPGSSSQVSNSQCTLSGTGSSYAASGNTGTLNVALTFSGNPLASIYLFAAEKNGASSGWVREGFWGASAGSPSLVSLAPSLGSASAQTFTAEYSDPNGVADLSKVALLFNSAISSAKACSVSYSPSLNLLYLVNDVGSGLQGSVTPGSSATVSNSQCKLSGTGSSYSTSGNTATLNVSLTFNVAFLAATEQIYLYAAEANGTSVGWSKEGTWGGAPTFASLTPNSGSATAQTFAAVVSDPNGIADLTGIYLLFNTSITAGKACYILYYPSSNLLYLKNDAGTAVSAGIAPGSSATASNSQCTLAGTGSSYLASGNTATLNVALTFSTAFLAPPKAIYAYALEKDGITSGWVREGTWGVSAGLPSILPESADQPPNSYTAKYTDPNGVADLTTLGFLISSSSTQLYNACYVSYFPALNELRLENDNGTGWVPGTLTPGSSGTLSNSQCTLSGTGTSYTTSVHTGTLTLAVAYYYSGYEGFAYLLATELNFTSTGWVQWPELEFN